MAYLSITLPHTFAALAAMVGRALDPDTGGDKSFVRDVLRYEGEEVIYADTITAAGPCTEAFHAQVQAMMADASLLHAVVAADYAARWAELVPPTLAECESFVNAIIQPEVQDAAVVNLADVG